jgi:hypothetical protein
MKITGLFSFLILILALAACEAASPESSDLDPNILFQDDFSDPASSWDDFQDEYGATQYRQGTYQILVNEPNTDLWANPSNLIFTDTQIEVEAERMGGSSNNIFGIICRYQDSANFYQLLVSSDGYYDISKVQNNSRVPLTAEQLLPSDKIPQDEEPLKIRADCIGDTLTLYVDDQQIAFTQDDDFSSGNIGLIAGAYQEAGTDIAFDNLVVRRP